MPDAGGPTVMQNEGNKPSSAAGVIPFRRATTPRTNINIVSTGTMSQTVAQPLQVTIEGTGYMTGIDLDFSVTTAGNAAATAYNEDAPWNVLTSIVLSDVSGELLNLDGYMQYLFNVYGGYAAPGTLIRASTDTTIYNLVSGVGATGGSFRFHLLIPVAINERNFLGLVGNQDRSIKYQLRTDIAVGTTVYSTPPTTPGAINLTRTYTSVTVPGNTNAQGIPQQIRPPKFGVQHFQTSMVNPNPPAGGSTVNHLIARLGNTIRFIILVFRANGSRATAEANMPTRIQFLIGDTNIFTETSAYRRKVMYDRYGFDTTAAQAQGVLVYDFIKDIINQAGSEIGLDYLWTGGIVNAQFQNTYPTGFGTTNNSLVIGVDDLIVPDDIDLYAGD